jgi:hypothetical protein
MLETCWIQIYEFIDYGDKKLLTTKTHAGNIPSQRSDDMSWEKQNKTQNNRHMRKK